MKLFLLLESAHLELDLILSSLELLHQIGAVDDIGDGVADVGTGGVVVIVLLNDRNESTHSDDVGIDGLAAEVLNAFLIHVGLAGADAAGDDAAVAQRGIIGRGAAAEGLGQEVLREVGVLAVGGDVQGRAAVGRIAFRAGEGRDGGDFPLARRPSRSPCGA